MLKAYIQYLKTITWSRKIRRYLEKNGFQKTVEKYPNISERLISTADEINKIISDAIRAKKPFMVARFGSIELECTGKADIGIKYRIEKNINTLCSNAGFFPNESSYVKVFSRIMKASMKYCDVQGIWYLPFEDYYLNSGDLNPCMITEARYLEPWFSNIPWTKALAGKKVLVIHPFDNLIKEQYKKRDFLFLQKDILPEFNLKTLQAVQTIAGVKDYRFNTWFDALNYMCKEVDNIDYDVAIVGCGAYGYPLAAHIKRSGKIAIHLGGVTQVLFGIKGKRWDTDLLDDTIRNLYNEFWVYPGEKERPKGFNKIENGCYW